MRTIRAADLFCGAGGASNGFVRACRAAGLDYDLLAVNHWPVAIDTHSANHPGVRHLCESVERIDPREVVPGGRLHLLMAGPECTHFSSARGGRPVNPQSRASAWHILKWAQELYIDTILIENVPEFRTWGPINADGRPSKRHKGETYRAFLDALRSLGYRVEDRILNAADYGDPTTRQRLFIMARRGRHRIHWPAPTHSKTGQATLFGGRQRWKPAREVIDWSLKGKSIFHRKKPLRPAIIARILAGLEKFGGPELRPFLVVLRQHMAGRSIDDPVPTLAANGQHVGLAQPFLMHITHGSDVDRTRSVDTPLPTVTGAKRGELAIVEPYVLQQQSGGVARSVSNPLPTIAAKGAVALVEPFVISAGGPKCSARSVEDPLGTVLTRDHRAVVEPFLTKYYGSGDGASPVTEPTPTVTTKDRFGLVEPFIFANRTNNAPKSIEEPVPALCTGNHIALVQPVIDGYVLDIRFRMLQPHELAAAMSFPRSYVFTGNREDVVKQIGNSWPGELSRALCAAALEDYAGKRAPWRDEAAEAFLLGAWEGGRANMRKEPTNGD